MGLIFVVELMQLFEANFGELMSSQQCQLSGVVNIHDNAKRVSKFIAI